jgi:hypothetical protein
MIVEKILPIFNDPLLQKRFDEDGFVKISLISEEDINSLRSLFAQFYPNPSQDFYSSSYENDFPAKKRMSDAIGQVIVRNLEKIFNHYTWFGSAFLSKGNGPRSEMPMHQDWTIVDEKKYVAVNIWTPLQDTDEMNGTIEVIKGSHAWHQSLRAPTLPFYYEGHQDSLKKLLMPIAAKAGEAIVLNQAIIHYSKPNRTDEMRIAITTGIKSKEAPMVFHYWDKEAPDKIELFAQEDDFLIKFENFHQSIFQRPTIGRSLGVVPFQLPRISNEELIKSGVESKSMELIPKQGLTKKIMGWIRG